ncbi:MAG: GH3 auxin-responsive promoter family protein, partial [Aureibaculum sp.]|nr:GH3 auxin-responsive promoter family protein [Aureibaculum sp.]
MSVKSIFAVPIAKRIQKRIYKWAIQPEKTQQKVFKKLITLAKNTSFGNDHNFSSINSYEDFKKHVPVRDYEALKPYVDKIIEGKADVLWKGMPLYFAKTSGTTSGAKYIPITKASMP